MEQIVVLAMKANREVILIDEDNTGLKLPSFLSKTDDINAEINENLKPFGFLASYFEDMGTYKDGDLTYHLMLVKKLQELKQEKQPTSSLPFYAFVAYCKNGQIKDLKTSLACFKYVVM